MPADNSHHIIAAARRRSQQTRERALAAIRRMDAAGSVINFDTVAREANVARSWLYSDDDVRAHIEQLRQRHRPQQATPVPHRQRATEASLRQRIEAATNRIRQLEEHNRKLRDALAVALGERRTADLLGQTNRNDTPKEQASKIIGPG